MSTSLVEIVEVSNLPATKSEFVLGKFRDYFDSASAYGKEAQVLTVTDETQIDLMAKAKERRSELKRLRCDVENTRKELKEQIVREGKAIDGIANVIKAIVVPIEKHLEKQEKFVEIREEERRVAQLEKRRELLSKYVPFEEMKIYNLSDMSIESFDQLLENNRLAFEARAKAEREAEEQKIRDAEEERKRQEEIKRENERLKKEAAEREEADRNRREKEEKEKKAREAEEAKQREAREEADRKKKAKQEEEDRKQIEAHEKQLADERKKTEAAQKEKQRLEEEQRQRDKEIQRKREEEEGRAMKALLAPDKEKLLALASFVEGIPLPALNHRESGKILDKAQVMLSEVGKFIREQSKGM